MVSDGVAAPRRVLVVGATGILRPAADRLLAAGDTVVAAARGRVRLTALEADGGHRAEVVPVDVTRGAAVEAAVTPGRTLAGPLDAALVYAPRPPSHAFEQVLARVDGRVVRVLTSGAAAPDAAPDAAAPDADDGGWRRGPRAPGEVRLLLGWTGPAGEPRWHTPDEVSAAALDTLDRGEDTVLGRVRPWTERP